jgi:hypothetical protein
MRAAHAEHEGDGAIVGPAIDVRAHRLSTATPARLVPSTVRRVGGASVQARLGGSVLEQAAIMVLSRFNQVMLPFACPKCKRVERIVISRLERSPNSLASTAGNART